MALDPAPGSVPAPKPISSIIHKAFVSETDSRMAHMKRILATSSGIDSTLLLLGYSLTFVHPQLQKLVDFNLKAFAEKFGANAAKLLYPGEALIASIPAPLSVIRLADLAASVKALGGMCSEVRAFMRLWGLLGIWGWARRVYFDPPKDGMLHALSWAQIASMGAFLCHENPYFLSVKGVLRGWTPEQQGQWFRRSIACFGAYLFFDYLRLWRVSSLASQKDTDEKGRKMSEQEEAAWWKALQYDLCYTPLAYHWGVGGGIVSDTWIGLLGSWVGIIGFRDAWKQTAE